MYDLFLKEEGELLKKMSISYRIINVYLLQILILLSIISSIQLFVIYNESLIKNREIITTNYITNSLKKEIPNDGIYSINNQLQSENILHSDLLSNYIISEKITILNDSAFSLYGLPGSGTEKEPYLIENYHTERIHIQNTTKYFIIKNCFFDERYGITIFDVSNHTTTIVNNIFCQNMPYHYAIRIDLSNFCTIENNTCLQGHCGIGLYDSHDLILRNNTFKNQFTLGFHLESITNSTFIANTCNNTRFGIDFVSSSNCTFENNFFNCSEAAFHIPTDSNNLTIVNNVLYNSGIVFSGLSYYGGKEEISSNFTVNNNTLNDAILGFYTNLQGGTFSESIYSQLIFINCKNLIIANQQLSNVGRALNLYACNSITINNNNFSGNRLPYYDPSLGILLYDCSDCTIESNICNNNDVGIFIAFSNDISVKNNIVTINSDYNIYVYYTSESEIKGNICNYCDYGLALSNSDKNQLENNTCIDCIYGLTLYHCDYNTILNGSYQYGYFGIAIGYSENNIIIYNNISKNSHYGIIMEFDSDNNTIHHNIFIDNYTPSYSQASDSGGENNLWYDEEALEGNYWSDWTGSGGYEIDGTAGSIDLYPLSLSTTNKGGAPQLLFIITIASFFWMTIKITKKRKQNK